MKGNIIREKVFFELEKNQWHGHASESLWCIKKEANNYIVDNIPAFIYGLSLGDIVKCKRRDDGRIWFTSVIERSGNSNYRLRIDNEEQYKHFEEYYINLKVAGCTYESTNGFPLTIAINVPSISNIYYIYSLFEKAELDGIWTFEEGYCGHSTNI